MHSEDDQQRDDLAQCLKLFATGAKNGRLKAVFCVGIGDDGPLPAVLVDPEDRETLIIAINDELTRMLGSPHHVISTNKLEDFLGRHNITDQDLLDFKASRLD